MSAVPYELLHERVEQVTTVRHYGKVSQVVGLVVESAGPAVPIGRLCMIENHETGVRLPAEVVGFRDDRILLMPYGSLSGITPGAIVTSISDQLRVPVGDGLIGRVLGGLGEPIDGRGPILSTTNRCVAGHPVPVLSRRRITESLSTGVAALDLMTTVGRGQRLGIFAGSGVGKSVLLGMLARGSSADVTVIGLIGERGREVRDFVEKELGPNGLKRSVVVAVSSDQPPLVRIKGAMVATAIAEQFRDEGKDVLFLLDSITRVAMAQREIGLAVGEPPATKGYTPSVFTLLPTLLERAGSTDTGSITGLYTVFVEADDFNEPISDAVRSILDGHITLSRRLARRNQYPAIDYLDSISRLMRDVVTPDDVELAGAVRELAAAYAEAEDLITIGAYVSGSDPKIDRAIATMPKIDRLFRQQIDEIVDPAAARSELRAILADGT